MERERRAEESRSPESCWRCGRAGSQQTLLSCPLCGRAYCRRCATRRHGKTFCGIHCADLFYFGDEDD